MTFPRRLDFGLDFSSVSNNTPMSQVSDENWLNPNQTTVKVESLLLAKIFDPPVLEETQVKPMTEKKITVISTNNK